MATIDAIARSQQAMNSEPGERFEAAGGWLRTRPDSLRPMSRSVYIASPEGLSGKSTVALGLVDLLSRQVGRVGVFRPVIEPGRRSTRWSSC